MTYGVDYDHSHIFYAVTSIITVILGVYALINPDFFRADERKGLPRSARDIILGIWLIVAGASFVAVTCANPLLGLQYRARFQDSEVVALEDLFCKFVRSSELGNLPNLKNLPPPPYILLHCGETSFELKHKDCSASCKIIYRPDAYPSYSVEKASAYIFVGTEYLKVGPAPGLVGRIIVYDKARQLFSLWFQTEVSQGANYGRSMGPGRLQRLFNTVAARIAEEVKAQQAD